jgi:glycosyltransferase involved in cell wall biosynthesis
MALGFQRRSHDVAVACLYKDGPMAAPLAAAGIPVTSLHKPEGFHWSTARQLARLAREFRADVIHTHNPQVHHYGVLAAKMAGVKGVVNTLHGVNNLVDASRAAKLIYGLTGPWTGCIAAVSEASRKFFEQVSHLPKNKLRVIYNGIPLEPFLEVPPPVARESVVFGAVGRLVPVKDHKTAIRAFAEVARENPASRMELAGDGPLRQELESEVARLGLAGRVIFRGDLRDIPGFLAGVDAFLMSSLSEGLPMSLLEAMAAGRVVVSTDVGGIPEVVEAAQCGWLSPPGDVPAMVDAMRKAIQAKDRVAMAAAGRRFVTAHCSATRMVESYEAVFTSLVKLPRRSGT